MIALVDCNNFYVSCERAFNPSLVGKPVVVLSNNDGCVISRSNEAKDIGIPMGAPTHQISYEVKAHNVAVFSSNYELYGDMSNRIMALLKELSPRVENYSIDEAFLHLDVVDDLEAFAEKIKYTIFKGTGIPVTIGIAPTKTLAKVANKAAKKLSGISILDTPEKIEQSLKNTPIEAVWGIGWSLSKKLIQYNIKTAYLFSHMSPAWVKKTMSITGLRMQQELKGIACIDEENQFTEKKMICTSRSFGKFQSDITEIEEAVAFFASSCAEKLRKQKSCAGVITVFLQTNFHNKTIEQHSSSHTICMPVATQASNEIIHYALLALEKVYAKGFAFKKAGVIVSAIVDESTVQTHLFDTADRDKQTKTMQLMDKINKQYGAGKLKMAVQGNKTGWQLKREKLSKSYSTDWKQLIEIK